MAQPAVSPGAVLGDRYVVRAVAWQTPLGTVWAARDRVLDRAVFVLALAPALVAEAPARRAFLKTAARVAQVTHPALLQVFDIGDDPPFVVFEHAGGGRLSERLRSGPMRPNDAARTALAIARAVEALHQNGVSHSDVSPDVVLLDQEGRPKLLVTGSVDVARAIRVADATKARVTIASEQPASYRPPEPGVTPTELDRFALAALTYHMLTGRTPAPGRTARAERRSVPHELDALLRRALSVSPADRPTLDEFVGTLAPFTRVEPKAAKQPRLSGGELRWVVPVLVIVALAVGAVTFGVRLAGDIAERLSPAPSRSATARPAGRALPVRGVTDFDPLGNREENPDDTDRVIDGDPETSWRTECYRTAGFSGKDGVGLLFDLGTPRTLREVRVQTELPGWKAEIRVADEEGRRPNDFRVVKSFTAEPEQRLRLPSGVAARYVLLWITDPAETDEACRYRFRASVGEVGFLS